MYISLNRRNKQYKMSWAEDRHLSNICYENAKLIINFKLTAPGV
jgi:hypothetical protein